ncbi:unnamed protein product [Parnassius apollo]|uniref:(apollo) hypothetical protein n=1 Tax=Parnassius apollo TaxID=110799 RepID=A0A8S3WHF0_PARAO|nr:unnamed protein product [Parnassius apollo]
MSDKMTSYSSPFRKTVKWYKKLAIELILNTALVNAWIMYKENKNTNQGIVQFRRQLVEYLVDSGVDKENCEQQQERPKRMKHELLKREGPVAKLRRFCVGCYKENVKNHGSKVARNKTKKSSYIL